MMLIPIPFSCTYPETEPKHPDSEEHPQKNIQAEQKPISSYSLLSIPLTKA